MRRISKLLVMLVALLAWGALGTTALAGAASKPEASVKLKGSGQKQLLKKGLKVKVATKGEGKVKVKATSKTFDKPKFKKLAKTEKVNFKSPGKETLLLELTKKGRKAVAGCEARTLRVAVKGDKATAELKRNTKQCKPQPIDLSRAESCDFIAAPDQICMLPFPDDFHTVKDKSTATGRLVSFDEAAMPRNEDDEPMVAGDYNRNDGFSPGQTIVTRVPGLDTPEAFAATNPIPLNDLSRNDDEAKNEPIVVINARTKERHPIWVELDSQTDNPERTSLLIHPATNFDAGERYIVAMRKLKGGAPYAEQEKLPAPEGFRYYRDDLPSKEAAIDSQRKRFEKIFKNLRKAEVKRKNLYLAWDFTVSSDENIAERMLHIRDDAFGQLGDTNLSDVTVQGDSPSFNVTSVENFAFGADPLMARRIQGTFEVPCYLTNPDPGPECAPGSRFQLGPNGLPSRTDTWTANFNCAIPRKAIDDELPGRPQVYGHGLLGSANQATSTDQKTLAQAHNFVICATDEIGFSTNDVPNIATNILPQMGNFPELTDRVQQGLLNELFLGRLMLHEDGFLSDAAFHVDDGDAGSGPVIDNSRLYYNGNSQGGILGGAATAVAPDWTRASLGVPGMNYSVLLNRSVDFDVYKTILDPAYPDPVKQQLVLSLVQMLWDRSDPNGYAHRMTDNPLANTPAHEVLMNVAFGDHQVTTWQADVEARTIGASIHDPVVYDGRWPGVDIAWGIPRIESYPFTDSAIVYWDSGPVRPNPGVPGEVIGTDPPPITNTPNRSGEDPHGDPRVAPDEMQMVSDFLRPDAQSLISDTCAGPCFAGGFTGP